MGYEKKISIPAEEIIRTTIKDQMDSQKIADLIAEKVAKKFGVALEQSGKELEKTAKQKARDIGKRTAQGIQQELESTVGQGISIKIPILGELQFEKMSKKQEQLLKDYIVKAQADIDKLQEKYMPKASKTKKSYKTLIKGKDVLSSNINIDQVTETGKKLTADSKLGSATEKRIQTLYKQLAQAEQRQQEYLTDINIGLRNSKGALPSYSPKDIAKYLNNFQGVADTEEVIKQITSEIKTKITRTGKMALPTHSTPEVEHSFENAMQDIAEMMFQTVIQSTEEGLYSVKRNIAQNISRNSSESIEDAIEEVDKLVAYNITQKAIAQLRAAGKQKAREYIDVDKDTARQKVKAARSSKAWGGDSGATVDKFLGYMGAYIGRGGKVSSSMQEDLDSYLGDMERSNKNYPYHKSLFEEAKSLSRADEVKNIKGEIESLVKNLNKGEINALTNFISSIKNATESTDELAKAQTQLKRFQIGKSLITAMKSSDLQGVVSTIQGVMTDKSLMNAVKTSLLDQFSFLEKYKDTEGKDLKDRLIGIDPDLYQKNQASFDKAFTALEKAAVIELQEITQSDTVEKAQKKANKKYQDKNAQDLYDRLPNDELKAIADVFSNGNKSRLKAAVDVLKRIPQLKEPETRDEAITSMVKSLGRIPKKGADDFYALLGQHISFDNYDLRGFHESLRSLGMEAYDKGYLSVKEPKYFPDMSDLVIANNEATKAIEKRTEAQKKAAEVSSNNPQELANTKAQTEANDQETASIERKKKAKKDASETSSSTQPAPPSPTQPKGSTDKFLESSMRKRLSSVDYLYTTPDTNTSTFLTGDTFLRVISGVLSEKINSPADKIESDLIDYLENRLPNLLKDARSQSNQKVVIRNVLGDLEFFIGQYLKDQETDNGFYNSLSEILSSKSLLKGENRSLEAQKAKAQLLVQLNNMPIDKDDDLYGNLLLQLEQQDKKNYDRAVKNADARRKRNQEEPIGKDLTRLKDIAQAHYDSKVLNNPDLDPEHYNAMMAETERQMAEIAATSKASSEERLETEEQIEEVLEEQEKTTKQIAQNEAETQVRQTKEQPTTTPANVLQPVDESREIIINALLGEYDALNDAGKRAFDTYTSSSIQAIESTEDFIQVASEALMLISQLGSKGGSEIPALVKDMVVGVYGQIAASKAINAYFGSTTVESPGVDQVANALTSLNDFTDLFPVLEDIKKEMPEALKQFMSLNEIKFTPKLPPSVSQQELNNTAVDNNRAETEYLDPDKIGTYIAKDVSNALKEVNEQQISSIASNVAQTMARDVLFTLTKDKTVVPWNKESVASLTQLTENFLKGETTLENFVEAIQALSEVQTWIKERSGVGNALPSLEQKENRGEDIREGLRGHHISQQPFIKEYGEEWKQIKKFIDQNVFGKGKSIFAPLKSDHTEELMSVLGEVFGSTGRFDMQRIYSEADAMDAVLKEMGYYGQSRGMDSSQTARMQQELQQNITNSLKEMTGMLLTDEEYLKEEIQKQVKGSEVPVDTSALEAETIAAEQDREALAKLNEEREQSGNASIPSSVPALEAETEAANETTDAYRRLNEERNNISPTPPGGGNIPLSSDDKSLTRQEDLLKTLESNKQLSAQYKVGVGQYYEKGVKLEKAKDPFTGEMAEQWVPYYKKIFDLQELEKEAIKVTNQLNTALSKLFIENQKNSGDSPYKKELKETIKIWEEHKKGIDAQAEEISKQKLPVNANYTLDQYYRNVEKGIVPEDRKLAEKEGQEIEHQIKLEQKLGDKRAEQAAKFQTRLDKIKKDNKLFAQVKGYQDVQTAIDNLSTVSSLDDLKNNVVEINTLFSKLDGNINAVKKGFKSANSSSMDLMTNVGRAIENAPKKLDQLKTDLTEKTNYVNPNDVLSPAQDAIKKVQEIQAPDSGKNIYELEEAYKEMTTALNTAEARTKGIIKDTSTLNGLIKQQNKLYADQDQLRNKALTQKLSKDEEYRYGTNQKNIEKNNKAIDGLLSKGILPTSGEGIRVGLTVDFKENVNNIKADLQKQFDDVKVTIPDGIDVSAIQTAIDNLSLSGKSVSGLDAFRTSVKQIEDQISNLSASTTQISAFKKEIDGIKASADKMGIGDSQEITAQVSALEQQIEIMSGLNITTPEGANSFHSQTQLMITDINSVKANVDSLGQVFKEGEALTRQYASAMEKVYKNEAKAILDKSFDTQTQSYIDDLNKANELSEELERKKEAGYVPSKQSEDLLNKTMNSGKARIEEAETTKAAQENEAEYKGMIKALEEAISLQSKYNQAVAEGKKTQAELAQMAQDALDARENVRIKYGDDLFRNNLAQDVFASGRINQEQFEKYQQQEQEYRDKETQADRTFRASTSEKQDLGQQKADLRELIQLYNNYARAMENAQKKMGPNRNTYESQAAQERLIELQDALYKARDKYIEKYGNSQEAAQAFQGSQAGKYFEEGGVQYTATLTQGSYLADMDKFLDKLEITGPITQQVGQNVADLRSQITSLTDSYITGKVNLTEYLTKLGEFQQEYSTQMSKNKIVNNAFGTTENMINQMQGASSGKIDLWSTYLDDYATQNRNIFENFSSGKINLNDAIDQINTLRAGLDELRKSASNFDIKNNKGEILGALGSTKDWQQVRQQMDDYAKSLDMKSRVAGTFKTDEKNGTASAVYKTDDGSFKRITVGLENVAKAGEDARYSMRGYVESVNQASGFSTALAGTLKSVLHGFTYMFSAYRIVMRITSAFKEGFNTFKEYDSALTQISYTMDLNSKQLDNLGQSAIKMSQDLSMSLDNAMTVYKIYANMQTTPEEIQAIAKPTAILSNLSGADTSTAADQVQGIIQQFNLLDKAAGQSAADVSMHVVDVLDKISANVAIDYAEGINVITEAVTQAGAVAYDAGLSYEQLAAISAKVAERTREDGSTIGNAIKTIATRLSKVGKMPEYADEVDNATLSKASESLNKVGIAVYNADGSYRELDVILSELHDKWDSLTDAQKANISFNIAATRQTAKFKNILEAWTGAMDLANEATDTSGNALANQEKYEDSIAGRLQKLSATASEFWVKLYNSDLTKGVISFLTSLMQMFNNLADAIGAGKAAFVGLAGAITAFTGAKMGLSFLSGIVSDNGGLISLFKNIKAGQVIGTSLGTNIGKGVVEATTSTAVVSGAAESGAVLGQVTGANFATTLSGLLSSLAIPALILAPLAVLAYIATKPGRDFNKTQKDLEKQGQELDSVQTSLQTLKGQREQVQNSINEISAIPINARTLDQNIQLDNDQTKLEELDRQITAKEQSLKDVKEKNQKLADEMLSIKSTTDYSKGIEVNSTNGTKTQYLEKGTILETTQNELAKVKAWREQRDNLQKEYDALNKKEKKSEKGKSLKAQIKETDQSINNLIPHIKKNQEDLQTIFDNFDSSVNPNTYRELQQVLDGIATVDMSGLEKDQYALSSFFSTTDGDAAKSGDAIKEYILDRISDGSVSAEQALRELGLSIKDLGVQDSSNLEAYFNGIKTKAQEAKEAIKEVDGTFAGVEAASSSDNAGKRWDAMAGYIKTAKELYDKGQVGTDDFQTVAAWMSPKKIDTSKYDYASEAYTKAWEKSYKKVKSWFNTEDETKSVKNFVNDLKDVKLATQKGDEVLFNFDDTNEAAEKLGVNVQVIDTLLHKLEDYGFEFDDITFSGEKLEKYSTELQRLTELRDSMAEGEERDKLSLKIEDYNDQYEKYQNDIGKLDEEAIVHIKFEYDLAEAKQKVKELEQIALQSGNDPVSWAAANAAKTNTKEINENQGSYDEKDKGYKKADKRLKEAEKELGSLSGKKAAKARKEISANLDLMNAFGEYKNNGGKFNWEKWLGSKEAEETFDHIGEYANMTRDDILKAYGVESNELRDYKKLWKDLQLEDKSKRKKLEDLEKTKTYKESSSKKYQKATQSRKDLIEKRNGAKTDKEKASYQAQIDGLIDLQTAFQNAKKAGEELNGTTDYSWTDWIQGSDEAKKRLDEMAKQAGVTKEALEELLGIDITGDGVIGKKDKGKKDKKKDKTKDKDKKDKDKKDKDKEDKDKDKPKDKPEDKKDKDKPKDKPKDKKPKDKPEDKVDKKPKNKPEDKKEVPTPGISENIIRTQAIEGVVGYTKALQNLKGAEADITQGEIGNHLKSLNDALKESGLSLEDFGKKFNIPPDVLKAMDDYTKKTEKNTDATKDNTKAHKKSNDTAEKGSKKTKDNSKETKKNTKEKKENKDAVKKATKALDSGKLDTKTVVKTEVDSDKLEKNFDKLAGGDHVLTFTANVEKAESTVAAIKNEDGTISYFGQVDGVTVELEKVTHKDGSVTYEVKNMDTLDEAKKKVEEAAQDEDATITATTKGIGKVTALAGAIAGVHSRSVTVRTTLAGATASAISGIATAIKNLHSKTITVTTKKTTVKGSTGVHKKGPQEYHGTAHASGTIKDDIDDKAVEKMEASGKAYARGNLSDTTIPTNDKWQLPRSEEALVGEVGQELVVDPNSNSWYTVGDNGAEFAYIPKGAIVFNDEQTRQLFANGYINSRGKAFAEGTALAGGEYLGGASSKKKKKKKSTSKKKKKKKSTSKKKKSTSKKTSSTLGSADAIQKYMDQFFDFIEIRLDRLSDKIDRFGEAADNVDNTLDKSINNIKDALKVADQQVSDTATASVKYKEWAQKVAAKVGISQADKEGIESGKLDIAFIDASGKKKQDKIDKRMAQLEAYKEAWDKYEDALTAEQEALNSRNDLQQDLLDAITDFYDAEMEINEQIVDRTEAYRDYLDNAGIVINTDRSAEGKYNDEFFEAQRQALFNNESVAQTKYNEFAAQFTDLIKSGAITEGTTQYNENLATLYELESDYLEAASEREGFEKDMSEIRLEQIENITKMFTTMAERLESINDFYKEIGTRHERGSQNTKEQDRINYFNTLSQSYNDMLDFYNSEYLDSLKKNREAILADMATVNRGSERWVDLQEKLKDVDDSIFETAEGIAEIESNLNELRWDSFDEGIEDVSHAIEELENVKETFNDEYLIDDDGVMSSEGLSKIVLTVQQIEYANELIAAYRQALDILNEDYKNGTISLEDYNEKSREYCDAINDQALAVQDYKEEILDAYLEQQEKLNDLLEESIDKRSEALTKMKEYHDYQKTINENSKDITNLEMQIAALEGVSNQAGQARLALLKEQLAEAQEEMGDIKYDHSIDLRTDAYDKLKDNASKSLEELTRRVKTDTELQNKIISDYLVEVQSRYSDVYNAIDTKIKEVGLHFCEINEQMLNSMNPDNNPNADQEFIPSLANSFSDLGKNASDAKTSVLSLIDAIESSAIKEDILDKMKQYIDYAKTIAGLTSEDYSTSTETVQGSEKSPITTNDTYQTASQRATTAIKERDAEIAAQKAQEELARKAQEEKQKQEEAERQQLLEKVKSQINSYTKKGSKKKRSTYGEFNKQLFDKTGRMMPAANRKKFTQNVLGKTYDNDKKTGVLYKTLKEIGYFAKGSYNIPEDQMAWTQEKGQELIYRRADGAILTPLSTGDKVFTNQMSENLWKLAQNNALANALSSSAQPQISKNVTTINPSININFENFMHVEGNVDEGVVRDLKSFKAELIRDFTKELSTEFGLLGHKMKFR